MRSLSQLSLGERLIGCFLSFPPAGSLSAHHYFHSRPSELCCLLVDSGFSFTHVVPYCRSKKMKEGIRRSEDSPSQVPRVTTVMT